MGSEDDFYFWIVFDIKNASYQELFLAKVIAFLNLENTYHYIIHVACANF